MAEACRHEHAHGGLQGAELERALAEAEGRCAADQGRLTTPRRRVLELLLEADAPLKAYDIIAAYGADGAPAKPPTVYRALDFLERAGLAHRIESLNAYVSCRLDEAGHRAAFLICDCCGKAEEFDPDFTAQLSAAAARGYAVRALTLEARGLCAECQPG